MELQKDNWNKQQREDKKDSIPIQKGIAEGKSSFNINKDDVFNKELSKNLVPQLQLNELNNPPIGKIHLNLFKIRLSIQRMTRFYLSIESCR